MLGNRLRLFSRKRRQPPSEDELAALSASRQASGPIGRLYDDGPEREPSEAAGATEGDSSLGYELLLYGNEQILRGSDNGTLVAFAAIAFQQIRGRGALHNDVGCGILMLSVLLCAVIHFAIGYAYLGRARRMIGHQRETPRDLRQRKAYIRLAWITALVQFVCVILGTGLILIETAPPWLQRWLDNLFS